MRLQLYHGRKGLLTRKQWRARVIATNGNVLFVSAEGYNNLGDLLTVCQRLFPNLQPEMPS